MMSENHICAAAKAMAQTYTTASVPLYGKKLRLPDRQAVILLIKDIRRLIFPAYYGEAALMSLAPEDYAALLLERIEKQLFSQIALALPEEQELQAQELAAEMVTRLPKIAQKVQLDLEATFDGDPAAGSREEILFSYPGLFAILVYRVAHELYQMKVPILPRMMSEYAHSHTGIDIHPGAQIGDYFFIDHGTGIVVGETTVIGDRVKLYQGVTLSPLSPGWTPLPARQAAPHGGGRCDHLLRRVHFGRRDSHWPGQRGGRQRLPHQLRAKRHPGGDSRSGNRVQKPQGRTITNKSSPRPVGRGLCSYLEGFILPAGRFSCCPKATM